MNAAFVASGAMMIAGAMGLVVVAAPDLGRGQRHRYSAVLALHGVGTVTVGLFTLEAFLLHFVGFVLVLSPIVSFPTTARLLRRRPGWRRLGHWLRVASPLPLVLAVLYFATFDPETAGASDDVGGLTQRILLIQMHLWFILLGWRAFRAAMAADAGEVAARRSQPA